MSKKQKTEGEWKKELSKEEYNALRKGETEPPFTGEYWETDDDGMYVCKACGNKLFSSDTKFKSKSGWPSFTKPIEEGNIKLKEDKSHGMIRTEVVCGNCESHLGHVFDDGPGPDKKRYCINSVCLNLEKHEE